MTTPAFAVINGEAHAGGLILALSCDIRVCEPTANSSTVISAIKRGLNIRASQGEAAAARFEWEEGRRLQSGPDAEEGVRAFLEKRSPDFQYIEGNEAYVDEK